MAEIMVNDENFATEVMQAELPVLMDVYADWCPPCKMLAPIIHQISEEYQGKLKVVKVNADHCPGISNTFQVSNIPALFYLQNGKVKGSAIGYLAKEELERKLQEWGQI